MRENEKKEKKKKKETTTNSIFSINLFATTDLFENPIESFFSLVFLYCWNFLILHYMKVMLKLKANFLWERGTKKKSKCNENINN